GGGACLNLGRALGDAVQLLLVGTGHQTGSTAGGHIAVGGILPRDAEVGDVLFGHGLGSSDVAVLVHRDLVQAGAVRGEAGVGVVVQAIQLALVRSGHCAGSAGGGGIELQASRASLQAVGVGAVDLD